METPRLVLGDVVFIHGVLLLRARSGVIGRGVHTPEMLGEEIFAVELVPFAFDGCLGARGAAVIGQTEMLRGYVALPFVF